MAFTKIAAAGIGSTELVTLHSLEVLNNATVGGVLTYEDVTNVDSVGLITARNGIVVGSGITLSKDGDIFFTGIATGNGSGLTNLATDLVNDTSPQLGGDLDTNSFEISLDDSHSIKFGNDSDFTIAHDGSNARLINTTGNLILFPKTGEYSVVCVPDGAVELYHDNELQAQTAANGLRIKTAGDTDTELSVVGPEGRNGIINLEADDGDDNADIWGLVAGTDGAFLLRNYASGSYETNLKAIGDGAVELYHNNGKVLETTANGVTISGSTTRVQHSADANLVVGATGAGGAYLVLDGDSNGDGAGGDYAYLLHDTSGNLNIIADNPAGNSELRFYSGNANLRCKLDSSGNFIPTDNNTYDLGSTSYRWQNIYTNDLNLSNEGSANSVDGTWGDYTIQEGESDLFLINKRSGKKYKFMLQEVS